MSLMLPSQAPVSPNKRSSPNNHSEVNSHSNAPYSDRDVKALSLVDGIFWGYIKGYPWWPCKVIANEEHLTRVMRSAKPKGTDKHVPVFYFGSHDYSWLPTRSVKPFEEFRSEFENKSKTKSFQEAVKEAKDTTLWPKHILMQTAPSDSEESGTERDSDEEMKDASDRNANDTAVSSDGLSDGEDGSRKQNKRLKKDGVSKRMKRTSRSDVKVKHSKPTSDKASLKPVNTPKSATKQTSVAGSKRRRSSSAGDTKDTISTKHSKDNTLKSTRAVSQGSETMPVKVATENSDNKYEVSTTTGREVLTKREFLMHLRLKLQIFLKNEDRQSTDFIKADKWLRRVEEAHVSLDLFRETKIGKFIKHMSKIQLSDDKYNFIQRCNALLERWKLELRNVTSDESIPASDTVAESIESIKKSSTSEELAKPDLKSTTIESSVKPFTEPNFESHTRISDKLMDNLAVPTSTQTSLKPVSPIKAMETSFLATPATPIVASSKPISPIKKTDISSTSFTKISPESANMPASVSPETPFKSLSINPIFVPATAVDSSNEDFSKVTLTQNIPLPSTESKSPTTI
ncbi:hypothetical protein BDV3_005498 [Batrachochytrium dendrobatidis]